FLIVCMYLFFLFFFFFQAEDGIRDRNVTGVQTCALPICTCFQNTSGMSVSPTGPEVEPHVTSRPPPLSARIESFHVAAPTFSMTTSTPRLSVASNTAFVHWGFVL